MENRTLTIIALVAIPLLSIIVSPFYPAVYDYFFPKNNLTWNAGIPVKTNDTYSLNVTIKNNGLSPEKNIKLEFKKDIYNTFSIKDVESSREVKRKCHENGCTVSIGDLRSGEQFVGSFIVEGFYLEQFYYGEISNLDVVSDDRVATQKYVDPSLVELYKNLFWSPIILLIIIITLAFFVEVVIKTPEQHIKWHESQIKLQKKKIKKENSSKKN